MPQIYYNMLRTLLKKQGYHVIKKKTDLGPIPQMSQYWLTNLKGQSQSFWTDIPINLDRDTVNCVVEIPKQMHGKFQVKKQIPYHPIMQDTRKNFFDKLVELRFYNQFPLFNYGYIPQTWEQNITKDQQGLFGDDDPIDICDLSTISKYPGQFFKAKVLGAFCLIDQGETDWKVLVMSQQEAKQMGNAELDKFVEPAKIQAIKSWFKESKVYDGKKPNSIAYGEKIFTKEQTLGVIQDTHKSWVELMTVKSDRYDEIRKKHCLSRREIL